MEYIRIAEHTVQSLATSTTPTGYTNTGSINKRILTSQVLHPVRLVQTVDCTYFTINTLTPFTTTRHIGTTIVNAGNDITQISQILVPHASTPRILYGRAGRFAIDVKNQRIFLVRIKIHRLNHPTVQSPIFRLNLEEFLRLQTQCFKLFLSLGIIGNHTHTLVSRE